MEKKYNTLEEYLDDLIKVPPSDPDWYVLDREHNERRREEILKHYLASALEYVEPSDEADQNDA